MIALVTALPAPWRTTGTMLAQAPGPVAVVIVCHDIPDSPLSRHPGAIPFEWLGILEMTWS